NDLWRFDRTCVEAKVESHKAHPGDHRQMLPAKDVLQHWRFAFRRPGACAAGTFGQTRFVYEDDDPSLPRCDFFSAGHLLDFQPLIAGSLRSRASLLGRWGENPIRRNVFHTEEIARRSPKRSSISAATRGSVHISVSYPAEMAPRLSNSASSFSRRADRRKRPARRPTS